MPSLSGITIYLITLRPFLTLDYFGTILGENTILHLENEPKMAFKAKNRRRKMPQSVIVRLTTRAEKALRQHNK